MSEFDPKVLKNLTDHARVAMAYANRETRRLNHSYIGTEHILLGLLKEHSGAACAVLGEFKAPFHEGEHPEFGAIAVHPITEDRNGRPRRPITRRPTRIVARVIQYDLLAEYELAPGDR